MEKNYEWPWKSKPMICKLCNRTVKSDNLNEHKKVCKEEVERP